MIAYATSIFKDPDVAKHLRYLNDKYFAVHKDMIPSNIAFACKLYQIDCLILELGVDNSLCNPTNTPTTLMRVEIISNHRFVLCSFGIYIYLVIHLCAIIKRFCENIYIFS